MRASVSVALLSLLAGCPAPPPLDVTGDPAISMLYPPHTTAALPLDGDCHLRTLVVVDLDGIDFVAPGSATEDVDGEGHWHAYVDPLSTYTMPSDAWVDLDVYDPTDPNTMKSYVGTEMRLWVQLQTNTHVPIDCPTCEDALEFELQDPLDCTPTPVGGS